MSEFVKILFTVENYYPKMSGVPVVVEYLAEGLVKKGHDITVATRFIEGSPKNESRNNVEIVRFNINYNWFKKPIGEVKKFQNFLVNGNYDAIIFECAQCVTTDAAFEIMNKIEAVKVLHSHGFSGLNMKLFKLSKSIRNIIANSLNYVLWKRYYSGFLKDNVKQFDELLCLSPIDSSIEYLKKYSNKEPIVLSNAAQSPFFEDNIDDTSIQKYVNLNPNTYYVSVANYAEYKNQIGILKEFYKTKDKTLSMVFIGSKVNQYYELLINMNKRLEKAYGTRKVYILTDVNRNDIPGIIKGASLYLVGSTFEEFSISLIEAMAVGTPFISTNVGNARILPGGITVDSITQLHNSINDLLLCDDRYKSFKNSGMEYTRKYCKINSVIDYLEKIIEN